ncbi:hypothetical protein P0082_00670 [Candidatus Haliotispira prima]|uniref:Uncharacterized protein n=1 Tax=Candidatus Haliotispira prima TaxID=3034016 RepID=A0ABY8MJL8_9SPIO|nr:hypothetical protein P0082_00670 [Candidatus Haliotispira prima]
MCYQVWLDGSSILRLGIALDYRKLGIVLETSLGSPSVRPGGYYDHVVPEGGNSKVGDREQLVWQQKEQQRAGAAGFDLRLSPIWSERVRCLFCSCLNAVQFPAPALLDLQGDLAALSASGDGCTQTNLLLSDSPALLCSLSKTRFDGSNLLQRAGIRLLLFADSADSLLLHGRSWPEPQQDVLQAACRQALRIDMEDVEWPEDGTELG